MNLRTLSPRDFLVPVAAIHSECFPDAWSVQAIADLLGTPGTTGLASDDGFILIRSAAGEAEILTLAVRSSARRKGIGAALVVAGARAVAAQGAETVFLEVAVGNRVAQALYTGLGFVRAGQRKGYYVRAALRLEDALILRSNLPLSPLGKSGLTG
jgi:[ribosomal protein S18]-alanine N-acetyltransferase